MRRRAARTGPTIMGVRLEASNDPHWLPCYHFQTVGLQLVNDLEVGALGTFRELDDILD